MRGRYYLCSPRRASLGSIVEFFHLIQFGMLADLCLDGGGRGTDKQKYGDQPYRLCFECRSHVYICLRGLETDIEL